MPRPRVHYEALLLYIGQTLEADRLKSICGLSPTTNLVDTSLVRNGAVVRSGGDGADSIYRVTEGLRQLVERLAAPVHPAYSTPLPGPEIVAQGEYRSYVSGGSWRCPESPIGAHHWKAVPGSLSAFRCVYCGSKRE